jgi:hypothetical protein
MADVKDIHVPAAQHCVGEEVQQKHPIVLSEKRSDVA